MAITTMDGLATAVANSQDVDFQKATMTSAVGFWSSLWAELGNPGAGVLALSTGLAGAIPVATTVGAAVLAAFTGANTGYLVGFGAVSTASGIIRLYDRLWHQGSISAAAAATTTFSGQPATWSRVPGSNWGECELWLEINVVIPATAVTVTVIYIDGAGASQTATLDTALTSAPVKRMLPFRLANGTGVKSITSCTVATPAASGSFNLVILRGLAQMNIMNAGISEPRQDFFKLGGQQVYVTSCLALMFLATGVASGAVFADVQVANG